MSPVYVTLYNTDTGQFTTRLATSGHIGSGELGAVHLRSQSLTSSAYASGSIGTEHLAAGAVTSAIIASGTVIALILSGSVGSGDIGDGAVVSGSVAASVLGGPHFANASFISANYGTTIGGVHILSGTITSGLLANQSILSAQIGANIVATPHITNQGILSASVGTNIVGGPHIANASLLSSNYGTTIAGVHIVAASLLSGNYGNTIGGVHILSGTITSGLLANQSVLSAQIGANIIANVHVANQGLTSATLASGIVGAYHLGAASYGTSGQVLTAQLSGIQQVWADAAAGLTAPILSTSYGSGSIGGPHVANQSLISAQIGANVLATPHIANQGVLSASYASGSVGTYHLGIASYGTSGQVITAQLSGVNAVWAAAGGGITSSDHAASGLHVSGHLAAGSVVSANYASGSVGSIHLAPDAAMQVLDVTNSVSGASALFVSTGIARRHYRLEIYITSGAGNLRGGLRVNGNSTNVYHSKNTTLQSGTGVETIVTTTSNTFFDFVGTTAAGQSGGACFWSVDVLALSGMPKLLKSEGIMMAGGAAGIVWGVSRGVAEAVLLSGGALNFFWQDFQNGNIIGPGSTMTLFGGGNL